MLQKCAGTDSRPGVVLVTRGIVLNKDKKILLMRRALNDRRHAGLWEVPGGKVEKGQDLATALEEELAQEAGLVAQVTPHMCVYDSLIEEGKHKDDLYVALFFVAHLVKGAFKLSNEHCGHAWVEYCEFKDYELTNETKYAFKTLKQHLV